MLFSATPFKPHPLCVAVSLSLLSSAVVAQDPKSLAPVVVTAAGFEQDIDNAPATISVITAEDLKKKSYTDITDALKHVAGVQVNGGGIEQTISIRGMEAGYTLFLIDGKPVQGNDAFSPNGQLPGNSVNFLPPIESIERIEVIRGPASALYGSDAMGGVINIITKKVHNEWGGSITAEYTKSPSANKVNEDRFQTSFSLNAPLIKDKLSLQLTGAFQSMDESNYMAGISGESGAAEPEYRQRNLGTKLSYNVNETNTVTLGGSHTQLERWHTAGSTLDATTTQTGSYTTSQLQQINGEYYVYWAGNAANQAGYYPVASSSGNTRSWIVNNTDREYSSTRDNYFVTHEGVYDSAIWNSYVNYDKSENPSRTNATTGNGIEFEVMTANSQVSYFLDTHSITGGVTYKYENLEDGATNGVTIPGIVASTDIVQMERYQYAAFLEDEWKATKNLSITFSGRYDHNEDFGGNFSPKVYGVYKLTETWMLKGGVTSGFKAPSLRQAAPDFGGTSMGGVTIGNPNLTPETSLNQEIGVSYRSNENGLSGTLTVYKTDFDDKINRTTRADMPAGCQNYGANATFIPADAPPCIYKGTAYPAHHFGYTSYENIDEVELSGVEHTLDYRILENLTYRHSYTYTDSEQKTGANVGLPLNNVVKHMFNMSVDWDVRDDINLWTQLNYRGKTSGTGDASTIRPSYAFVDAGVMFKPKDSLSLKAGVYNLANKEITQEEDYPFVLDGRRFIFSLTQNF